MDDDFAIDGGLEDGALGFEFFSELRGVGEVAVVRNGQSAFGAIRGERLRVINGGGAGGGIASMANGNVAVEIAHHLRGEHIFHQAHTSVDKKLFAIAGGDPGAFLSAVLKCVVPVIGHLGSVGLPVDAKDAAVVFRIVWHADRIQESRSRKRKGILRKPSSPFP